MTDKETAAKNAQEMIKAVYDDGEAEINGRTYKITTLTHKKRRKVFAFFTHHQHALSRGDFSCLESDEFQAVENVIENAVTFDGDLLSKRPTHWDECPEDYITFISTMLGVISYPFLKGGAGG